MRTLKMAVNDISIHPPCEGWDMTTKDAIKNFLLFQSTHPVRGGTCHAFIGKDKNGISIHPPREGWDPSSIQNGYDCRLDFNPPTP